MEDFANRKQQEKSVVPVPHIQMEWDEASCGQLVWLYNEAISRFAGQTETFLCFPRPPGIAAEAPGAVKGRSLRVASVDIGRRHHRYGDHPLSA
jgi:Uncharacterized protein conserved in bacteria, putative virulence factor, COG4457